MRLTTALTQAIVLFVACVNAQATQPIPDQNCSSPTVNLGYAKFRGYTNATGGVTYFRGIQ